MRLTFPGVLICILLFNLAGCRKGAGDPKEAAEILTKAGKWQIEEIAVNDAVTFKDGKMTSQFGGIDFERYMETVELKPDGTFSGVFKGETKPFLMRWTAKDKFVEVGLPGTKGGTWTIDPARVQEDSFVMQTQSTAYDFPRTTKIALKFKAGR